MNIINTVKRIGITGILIGGILFVGPHIHHAHAITIREFFAPLFSSIRHGDYINVCIKQDGRMYGIGLGFTKDDCQTGDRIFSLGLQGPTGATGSTGVPGDQGPTGATGAIGAPGSTGPIGATGAPGSIGSTGLQGIPGDVGPIGATGEPGQTGTTGPIGATGMVGQTGATGVHGYTIVSGSGNPNESADRFSAGGAFTEDSSESDRQTLMPNAQATRLFVRISTAPGVGKSWSITVRKNGSDTAMTCVISDTNLHCSDTVHAVSFLSGDLLSILIHPGTPSPTPAAHVYWSLLLE